MKKSKEVLRKEKPDAFLVLGDTKFLLISIYRKTIAYPDFSYGSR